jgi:hypothetical protein
VEIQQDRVLRTLADLAAAASAGGGAVRDLVARRSEDLAFDLRVGRGRLVVTRAGREPGLAPV